MTDGRTEAFEAMAERKCVNWPADLTDSLRSLRDAIWQLEQYGYTANETRLKSARHLMGDATASLGRLMSERGI